MALNGFFVAAEFALVKVRKGRLKLMSERGVLCSRTAVRLVNHLDHSLSACQLGITMASLGLGWVGEPAIARLIEPLLHGAGITSDVALHTVSFIIAFSFITAAHLVLGEQAPKILAIRKPETLILWCSVPLRAFFTISYPLIVGLSGSTSLLLKWFGVPVGSEHEGAHSEEEIRVLVSHAHVSGELSRSEHRLIDAVFEFDNTLTRQIMIPRGEVAFFDLESPLEDAFETHRAARRTRYPVCEGSMDEVRGVVHLKDLIGLGPRDRIDLRKIMRPPRFVPETMRIAKLLAHFQATHQHLAFVVDEYGTVSGIVTLENVLERIVGEVQDEFDSEAPDVLPEGGGRYLVQGGAPLESLKASLGLDWPSDHADTVSGFLMEQLGRVPQVGDHIEIEGASAVVVKAEASRATEVRIQIAKPPPEDDDDPSPAD